MRAQGCCEGFCDDQNIAVRNNPDVRSDSDQRGALLRRVTISLAEEVRRRHGDMGRAVVGYHVSKDRSASESTRLMYMTEAIGVYVLMIGRGILHTP